MESQKGFSRLIEQLPKTFKVLDIGCGGLQGQNTTNYLLEHFGSENIIGICKSDHEVDIFRGELNEKKIKVPIIISGDFYKHDFSNYQPFDLAVLDMNIDSNLGIDWTDEGLEKMKGFVKEGGYLINYVMLTDQYGKVPETPAFIRSRWNDWWNTASLSLRDVGNKLSKLRGWKLFAYEQEERRPYILWVMLKKINGLSQ